MGLINYCLRNATGVAVVIAIVMFIGVISAARLPIQLFPNIEQPQMSVQTYWRAASPEEMETVIVEEQEEVLRGMPGLEELRADIFPSFVQMNLTFSVDMDMDQALVEVISRMNRLPPLPADANPPVVQSAATGDSNDTLIYLFIQSLPDSTIPIIEQGQFILDNVVPRLEAIEGVAAADLQGPGNAPQVLEITFDPFLAAQYGIEIPRIAAVAGRAQDVTGGFVDIGRRTYMMRYSGEFSPDQLAEQILDWRDGRPVRLGDVAEVGIRRADRFAAVYQNGNPALGLRVFRVNGANVLTTIEAVKAEMAAMNEDTLAAQGLRMAHSYDPSVFIERAINLLTTNLAIGILLAVGALWLFLRNVRATLIIALTIPVSLFATLAVLQLTGRSLNVISLAGLAFAVGMVLDAAIVVLEGIVRQREHGHSLADASRIGASRVVNALIASTATTVAVFVPVIFLKDAEGQLFADLALTIAIAVSVSLVVALMVLPTAAANFLKTVKSTEEDHRLWNGIARFLMTLTGTRIARRAWIVILIIAPLVASTQLAPDQSYLPQVRRDAVDAFLALPPGSSLETVDREILQPLVERLQPFLDGEREPALRNYYIFSFPGGGSLGIRAADQSRVNELAQIVNSEILVGFPDTFGFGRQGNLFGGFGSSDTIVLNVQAHDPEVLFPAVQAGMGALGELWNPQEHVGASFNPNPQPSFGQPTLNVIPDDRRISEAGWSRQQVASIVRALGDGLFMGEYFDGQGSIDIILRTPEWTTPEELASIPLATPSGSVVPLGDLVTIQESVEQQQITRVDGRRTISIFVTPPDDVALERAIDLIEENVEPAIRSALGSAGNVSYGGSAGSLERVRSQMIPNLLVAVGVLYLLMVGMFRSFKDAGLVLLILPPAAFGGVMGLVVLNWFTSQDLDLLTMIGFIILAGIVVNNAILLVARTRQAEAEGLVRREAVGEALRVRLRPIFMTTLTTVMGMLPLVLVPGPGSAIYRGLAATIVGGMAVSTLFTLILLPTLLRMGEDTVAARRRRVEDAMPAAGR